MRPRRKTDSTVGFTLRGSSCVWSGRAPVDPHSRHAPPAAHATCLVMMGQLTASALTSSSLCDVTRRTSNVSLQHLKLAMFLCTCVWFIVTLVQHRHTRGVACHISPLYSFPLLLVAQRPPSTRTCVTLVGQQHAHRTRSSSRA